MKLFRLIILFLFYSVITFAQDSAVINLQQWQENYLFASKTYSELVEAPDKYENDSILKYNLNLALDKIILSLSNAKNAILQNSYYGYDARYMMVESSVLGLWFCQNERAKMVFDDSLALAFLGVCETFRPNVLSIPYYELAFLEIDNEDFYQSYYDQIFVKFLIALEKNDDKTVYKTGDEYLNNLMITFDREFPSIIFYNPKYNYEQSRVFKIIKEISPLAKTIQKKLELKLIKIEYLANFYFYEKQIDSTFYLNSIEQNEISACESFINENLVEFQKVQESSLRLADAYFLLGDFKNGIKYYYKGLALQTSSTVDLKKFIALTVFVADTTTDVEFKENCQLLVDNAANLIVINETPIEEVDDLNYLLKCYEFSGNVDKQTSVKNKLTKIEQEVLEREAKAKKREKYGFRLGIAPARLAYGSYNNSFSFTGDVKISGFEQGFRYCRYNDFIDYYRFGAWIYKEADVVSYNTYTGNEFSYWVTIYNNVDQDMEEKFCIEARYGNYQFEPVNASVIERETNSVRFYDYDVHAVAHRYDISAVYRLSIFASKIFYIEGNFALGIGFRYFTSEFYNSTFLIDDVRYSDDRWPKITAPVRFGLRCGIRFF